MLPASLNNIPDRSISIIERLALLLILSSPLLLLTFDTMLSNDFLLKRDGMPLPVLILLISRAFESPGRRSCSCLPFSWLLPSGGDFASSQCLGVSPPEPDLRSQPSLPKPLPSPLPPNIFRPWPLATWIMLPCSLIMPCSMIYLADNFNEDLLQLSLLSMLLREPKLTKLLLTSEPWRCLLGLRSMTSRSPSEWDWLLSSNESDDSRRKRME
mmetsp:Transcript_54978/g.116851  ORF Transcript_54978/g.116851 Transcript_54978/m.116851 type:complete len:213 (-) Transcript_54978:393-1031(-)